MKELAVIKKEKEKFLSLPAVRILMEAKRQINSRPISAYAGQTAFFLMLSFFPFLLFLFAILRLTPLTEEIFVRSLLTFIPQSFHEFIAALIHDIYSTSSIPVVSLSAASAIWLCSKYFICLIRGLNAMYRQEESRNYIMLRLFSSLYSIIFALLMVATLALLVFSKWINSHIVRKFPLVYAVVEHIVSLRMLIAIIPLLALFLLLYCVLPNCKWKLRYHVPGATLATLGWLLFSYLYSYYVDSYSNYSSFYGTMTTIALLMVWLYACMYILLFGGILNDFLVYIRKADPEKHPAAKNTGAKA